MTSPLPRRSREQLAQLHHHYREQLPMWVLHERPNDYPEGFVARLCVSLPKPVVTRVDIRGATRAAVEAELPPGLVFLARHPYDEPQIVGVWL